MNKKTSIALFLATTSVVALTSTGSSSLKAEESDLGGLKEWNTDMPIEADFKLELPVEVRATTLVVARNNAMEVFLFIK